jgi:hypothetical protein
VVASTSVDGDGGGSTGEASGGGGLGVVAWRFRRERIPPRPRGGTAAAESGAGGTEADGLTGARESSAGVPASSRCAAVVFGLSEESEELRREGGAMCTV